MTDHSQLNAHPADQTPRRVKPTAGDRTQRDLVVASLLRCPRSASSAAPRTQRTLR